MNNEMSHTRLLQYIDSQGIYSQKTKTLWNFNTLVILNTSVQNSCTTVLALLTMSEMNAMCWLFSADLTSEQWQDSKAQQAFKRTFDLAPVVRVNWPLHVCQKLTVYLQVKLQTSAEQLCKKQNKKTNTLLQKMILVQPNFQITAWQLLADLILLLHLLLHLEPFLFILTKYISAISVEN